MMYACVVYCEWRWLLLVQGECDPALGADFVFSVRSKELIVGEVYVRIYNEQPTFPLEVSLCP